jgi:hypothetical protein
MIASAAPNTLAMLNLFQLAGSLLLGMFVAGADNER